MTLRIPYWTIECRDLLTVDSFNDQVANDWVYSGAGVTTWTAENKYYEGRTAGSTITYIGDTTKTNYILETDLNLTAGSSAGDVFRRTDDSNYFQFMLQSGGSVFLQKQDQTNIGSAIYPTITGSDYRVKIDVSGNAINCYLNNSLVISDSNAGSVFPSGNYGYKIIAGSAQYNDLNSYQLKESIKRDATTNPTGFISLDCENTYKQIPSTTLMLNNSGNTARLSDWNILDEVRIEIGYSGGSMYNKFIGRISEKDPTYGGRGNLLKIEAKGYEEDLKDRLAFETYFDHSGGEIVKDLISKYADHIGTGSIIYSGTGMGYNEYRYMSLFDAINEAAQYDSAEWFIDDYRQLVYRLAGSTINSSINLATGSNIISSNLQTNTDDLVNVVYIQGDTEDILDQSQSSSGGSCLMTDTIAGSGFFIPTQNSISRFDLNINKLVNSGGVYLDIYRNSGTSQQSELVLSKTYDYTGLTNGWNDFAFDDVPAEVTGSYWWYAKTTAGSHWLEASGSTSGSAFFREYWGKSVSSRVESVDFGSIEKYDVKEKLLFDKRVKDEVTAEIKARRYLEENSIPSTQGTVVCVGEPTLKAGEKVSISVPENNINEVLPIQTVHHTISDAGYQCSLIVDSDLKSAATILKDHELRISNLESADVQKAVTKYYAFTDDFFVIADAITGSQRNIGSSFIYGHIQNGSLGVVAQGIQPYLGDHGSAWEAITL